MRYFRVGLTGGVASGKSTVARLFAAHGVPVIDTDELARAVVKPGEPALAAILQMFGESFRGSDGGLDRRRLRERVFAYPIDRERLEALLHPHIEAATLSACERAGGPYQLIVVPLLVESGFDRHVDRVLVVDCTEQLQRERLLARDVEEPGQVERMLAAQAGRDVRLRRADDVIHNDDGPEKLAGQVDRLHAEYLSHAAQFTARSAG